MSIFTTISRYAADYAANRRQLRTYLTVSSLPREIQKDIGWPDAYGLDERIQRQASRRAR